MPGAARLAARRAAAPLALMALLFFLSAQPDLGTGLGVWDTILRSGAHFIAYGALCALWWWTLTPLSGWALGFAALIALLYGISDEYHQTFVEGRAGTLGDLVIDAAGIAVATLLLRYHPRPRQAAGAGGGGSGR
jgi:VanZ family protein